TTVQRHITWDIANYTDATARQYLIDTYYWTINGGVFDGSKTIKGSHDADTLKTTATKTTLHGLGGNDTLTGGTTDDILVGGAGNDTLKGAGGRDVFDYGFKNAGNDTITDFTLGNTKTNTNADIIDLSDLLIGYSATSNLSDFVTVAADGANTKLTIDHDGTGTLNSPVTITLKNIAYRTDLLNSLITNGNLVLEGIKPTLMITGSGGEGTAANTITFNFSAAIKDGSFTVDDIGITNGTINSGSFTKVSETQYTVMVTPNLGGKHSNVAITVAANTFTDVAGNTNTTIAKNTTKISNLKELVNINGIGSDVDLTHWDVSHVSDAHKAFYSATTFNQDIGSWDVSKATDMSYMFSGSAVFNQNIGGWDVGKVTNMHRMFWDANVFNQDISSWNVSKVTNMQAMFHNAGAFNRNIGSWNISSLTSATSMFEDTLMTLNNMDSTLRGWAKLDTAAGESAIQSNVTWDIENYTDATARQYLIDTYHWTINDSNFDGSKTTQGDATANTLTVTGVKTILHGLGGNDTLIGSTTDDILVGGEGDDTLTGSYGIDVFDYGFKNAGNDTITDFTIGNTKTDHGADIINLNDLLVGYSATSNLSDFVTAVANGTDTKLTISYDGTGALNSQVIITLANVAYRANLLTDLIANGNLVLEAISPILTIVGSGGANVAANTITFNFNEAIRIASFGISSISVANGTINPGSFTKLSDTQYTIMVTPDLGGKHSNVAITVADNAFTDVANNTNTTIITNTTNVIDLKKWVDIDGNGSDADLTNWDMSHVSDASRAFFDATTFNQNIDNWDVSKVTNMSHMFLSAKVFNQNIGGWDVSKVTNMTYMFHSTTAFNQDIGSWDVGKVTDMSYMLSSADAFNQDIGNWDVSNVTTMESMFLAATAFNQDIGNWDISSLTGAIDMFHNTSMTLNNMDDTLRGWAKLDTAAGESAIQIDVAWGIENYTDATARQYLIGTYNWTIHGGSFDGRKTIKGDNAANILTTTSAKTTLHGLAGNDTLTGGTTDDILVGGVGNDTLTGANGRDIFDYGFKNAGNDFITDFTLGNTSINANADTINLSDLLTGYTPTSNLSDFITVVAEGANTKLTIDHDGTGSLNGLVNITLKNIAYRVDLLTGLIANGNLVLEASSPTLTIAGSGGTDATANTIIFNFSKAIKDGTFSIDDINIVNGTINSGSLTKVSETQYTIMVTPSLGGKHSNVAITVVANTFTDVAGNANVVITKNMTQINNLTSQVNINNTNSDVDLTHWDVTHVSNASRAFFNIVTFNQDISSWDVSNITDMSDMFTYKAVFNQDIGNWDVGNMINMAGMFHRVTAFNRDIGDWDVSKVTNMHGMFAVSAAFNQDIGDWDVSKVTNMMSMFRKSSAFNQNLSNWDISSLTRAIDMFNDSVMTTANMDGTLRGWAKLDTAAGESAIQSNVTWGIANYTDATARQYLIDTYHWTIHGKFDDSKTQQGTDGQDFLTVDGARTTLHGLGDNDMLDGSTTDDILIGGEGDDTLIGNGGNDIFVYKYENAGNDFIDDFTVGNTSTNANADIIDLRDLLIGYNTSNLSDFITVTAVDSGTKLTIDHDGARIGLVNNNAGADSKVSITLAKVTYKADLLAILIANGNLVLESVGPTLAITGSGGIYVDKNTISGSPYINSNEITFNFSESIRDGSFTIDDIGIVNGTIDSGSFTKVSGTQYTIRVTPSIGGEHSNVAITVAANTFTNIAGNANTAIAKNITKIRTLGDRIDIGKYSDIDLSNWDVSHADSMYRAFSNANVFNQYIGNWDVSDVTDMQYMFSNANAFNQYIGNWDVSKVTNMEWMFIDANSFNQDIGSWDVSKVTSMHHMFDAATSFNQDISNWNVGTVTVMSSMFCRAHVFNQDIGSWDVSNVTDMYDMFNDAIVFNQDISNWNVSKVTDMTGMFRGATIFNQDISSWDVSKVTDMSYMFSETHAFNQDISKWDVSKVTNMYHMFSGAHAFNQDIRNWEVSEVDTMSWMFYETHVFNQNISKWDVSKVTAMDWMFGSTKIFNQNIGNWEVSKVTNMDWMFINAEAFNQNIGHWNISSLTGATRMFNGSAMTIDNMDNTLRGWAKLDTTAGESAIQSDVTWGIANYTDATARQYLIDTYHWTINGGNFDGSKTQQGTNNQDLLTVDALRVTLHGLGGNDMLIGDTTDNILIGGKGDDILIGGGGKDAFVYKYENAGNDFIEGFIVGNTSTNANADVIDLRDLLIGYSAASNLSNFVTAVADGANTKLTIDHDGTGALNSLVSIVVTHAFTVDLLGELITNGNLVLE
ncbi:Chitinase (EC, partial [uncultured Gammaproteobacteria bacterium]